MKPISIDKIVDILWDCSIENMELFYKHAVSHVKIKLQTCFKISHHLDTLKPLCNYEMYDSDWRVPDMVAYVIYFPITKSKYAELERKLMGRDLGLFNPDLYSFEGKKVFDTITKFLDHLLKLDKSNVVDVTNNVDLSMVLPVRLNRDNLVVRSCMSSGLSILPDYPKAIRFSANLNYLYIQFDACIIIALKERYRSLIL